MARSIHCIVETTRVFMSDGSVVETNIIDDVSKLPGLERMARVPVMIGIKKVSKEEVEEVLKKEGVTEDVERK